MCRTGCGIVNILEGRGGEGGGLGIRALCVLERALPTELAQLAGPNHSHTEHSVF